MRSPGKGVFIAMQNRDKALSLTWFFMDQATLAVTSLNLLKTLSALSVSALRQRENTLQRQSAFLRHIQSGANENSNSGWKPGVVVSA